MRKKILLIVIILLITSACQATGTQPTITQIPPVVQTQVVYPTQTSAAQSNGFTLDYSTVASNVTIELVPAKLDEAQSPFWEIGPKYYRISIEGYASGVSRITPQIIIYSIDELSAANAAAGAIASDLAALLQSGQAEEPMPYLPLNNSSQVLHAQVKFLDFNGGRGVRYLAQFNQGIVPINNQALFYTFQGITSDGKHYIAVQLPVSLPALPSDTNFSEDVSDIPAYMAQTAEMLDQQPANSFTPDLALLDAMMQSIRIQ